MSEFADANISMVNDCWIKQLHFKEAGWIARTHAHTFDHQTLLAVGSLLVYVDGIKTVHHAPTIIVIEAGKHHMLQSLMANTVAYCIHPLRGEDLVPGVANEELAHLL